jgi:hypothetical protein
MMVASDIHPPCAGGFVRFRRTGHSQPTADTPAGFCSFYGRVAYLLLYHQLNEWRGRLRRRARRGEGNGDGEEGAGAPRRSRDIVNVVWHESLRSGGYTASRGRAVLNTHLEVKRLGKHNLEDLLDVDRVASRAEDLW